ncbi:MAG: gamma-glutamyltransferase [Tepidisphaeraceae bacterium]
MPASHPEAVAEHAMVATSPPLAVRIGIDILKSGGNAVDAAVAFNAAMGLMEPMSCGIGGDLYVLVWDNRAQKLYGLNASGRAPYASSIDHFQKLNLSQIPSSGPLSWSVPGCIDGWDQLLRRFGTMPLPQLLAPSITRGDERCGGYGGVFTR